MGGLEEELLCDGKNHTVTVVFDAGVCAVYFVTDGVFCDGGEKSSLALRVLTGT